ncbi:MAG: acyl-CoA dehydrogenase family protein, partial [Streptosporangiaceae bacterium]
MPIAVTTEQLAMAESVGQWAKRAGPVAAVRARETAASPAQAGAAEARAAATASIGAGPGAPEGSRGSARRASVSADWAGLADLGVFAIARPEQAGGAGGTTADVAVVAEQLAAVLMPGPVLPTLLAGLVLARQQQPGDDGDGPASGLLAGIAAGTRTVGAGLTMAANPTTAGGAGLTAGGAGLTADGAGLTAVALAGGGLRVSGTAGLVLGAGEATDLLLLAATESGPAWFWVPADTAGLAITPRTPVDFSRTLADVSLLDVDVDPRQVLGGDPRLVADLAATLAAAEAAGIATWCGQTATDYARTRQQFGRPIGSFQAVKHLCAQMLCRTELATAAAWDAACAADQPPGELALAAAAAAALAPDAAVDNAKDCIQVLGGIGFTWEHDAHLYLRRALALRSLLGGSGTWRARTAGLAMAGARRHGPGPSREAAGDEASAAGQVRAAARRVANGVSATPREHWRGSLAEAGYAAPSWPPPYGVSAGPAAQLIIDEELARAGLERPDLGIGDWAIPAILHHGTPAQLERFAGPTLAGSITWCQLFSEPEAGSDLASLRTKAVRTKGEGEASEGWRLTGQKVWTSLAAEADWAICLARTNPEVPQHKGITYFLVSMRDPGVQVRPLREITGRAMFNEVFLDDVFVPDDCVVGEPGEGWRVARTTLASERVAMVRGAGLGEDAEELLAAVAADGGLSDPLLTDQVGARLAESLALSVMEDRLATATARGDTSQTAAVRKLIGVAHRQATAETGFAPAGQPGAAADGHAADTMESFLLT